MNPRSGCSICIAQGRCICYNDLEILMDYAYECTVCKAKFEWVIEAEAHWFTRHPFDYRVVRNVLVPV